MPHHFTLRFIVGMALLLTNSLVGWAGIIYSAYQAKKTGKKYYIGIGTGIYLLSWGMLGLGMYLAGPDGLTLTKKIFRIYGWKTASVATVLLTAVYFFRKNMKKNRALKKDDRAQREATDAGTA